MTKIAFDLRMVGAHPHGIARYALELASRIPLLRPDWQFVALISPGGEQFVPDLPPNVRLRPTRAGFLSLWEQPDLALALFRERPSLFHATSFSVPAFWPGKLVVTLHDATHLALPEFFGWTRSIYYWSVVKPRVSFADRLITVSSFSRRELSRHLDLPADRFRVIPLGVGEPFHRMDRNAINAMIRQYRLPEKYFVAVGNVKRHKNLGALIQIAPQLPAPLVLVTGGGVGRAHRLTGETRELDHVPEDQMPALLSGAEALLLPSFHEGFGLPALEAMACGCPVIAADTSALPETCADAALYASPHRPDEWLEAAARIVSDVSLRQSLIQRGQVRAQSLSWEACAAQTLDVYQQSL